MRPGDRAQEIELAEYERNQARAIMPIAARPSATHCVDPHCGNEIPEGRRKARPGVQLCVECQELNDKKKKGRYVGAD